MIIIKMMMMMIIIKMIIITTKIVVYKNNHMYIYMHISGYLYYTLKCGMHLIVSMTSLSVVLFSLILSTTQFLLLIFQAYSWIEHCPGCTVNSACESTLRLNPQVGTLEDPRCRILSYLMPTVSTIWEAEHFDPYPPTATSANVPTTSLVSSALTWGNDGHHFQLGLCPTPEEKTQCFNSVKIWDQVSPLWPHFPMRKALQNGRDRDMSKGSPRQFGSLLLLWPQVFRQ